LLSLGVNEIVMVEALENCCASESTQAKLRSHRKVTIKTHTRVTGITEDGNGFRVTLEDRICQENETIYVDGVFVLIGQFAKTHMFRGIINLDDNSYILTGPNRETNVPGVYAAGDVVQKNYRYLTTAMANKGVVGGTQTGRFLFQFSIISNSLYKSSYLFFSQ